MKPTSDLFIKYLFGTGLEKDLLISFINAVLEDSGFRKVVTVELKNPFNIREYIIDKESILDIKATDDQGRIFDIEMQTQGESHFRNRSLYYWARNYSAQLEDGHIWTELKPVICINILDFILFEESTHYHSCFSLKESRTGSNYSDHMFIHFLELKKVTIEEKSDKLRKWLFFLKNEGTGDNKLSEIIENDTDIKKAHKRYVKFTHDEMLRDLYEAKIKGKRDNATMLHIGLAKAREKGLAEGRSKGLDEGRSKGRAEGLIQGIEQGVRDSILELAAKMIEEKFSFDKIEKLTGLSLVEIEHIVNTNSN